MAVTPKFFSNIDICKKTSCTCNYYGSSFYYLKIIPCYASTPLVFTILFSFFTTYFLATEVFQRCSINKTLLFTYSSLQLILYQILYLFFQNQTHHIYPNAYIQLGSLLAIIVFIPLRVPVNLIPFGDIFL